MLGMAALLIFTSMALTGYAVASWMNGRQAARRTLSRRLAAAIGGAAGQPASVLRDKRLSRIAFLNGLLERIEVVRPLVRLIRQAGLNKRVGEILLYMPLLACVGFLLTALMTDNMLLGFAVGVVAGASPLLVLQRLRRIRGQRFSEQLPDALDLIRAALQAGHGLLSAFAVVADEFPDPIAAEFREITEQMRLGLPMREALYGLGERIDDPNIPILIVGVLVAQEVGGNLAEVIDNVSYTIRERFKLLREMRVMTAQGRLSGMVLTALPFLVGLFMYFLNPQYFAPLLQSNTGRYMLAYAFVSIVVGHILIQRIVRIRV